MNARSPMNECACPIADARRAARSQQHGANGAGRSHVVSGAGVLLALIVACGGGEGGGTTEPGPTAATARSVAGAFVLTRESSEETHRGHERVEIGATVSVPAGARTALEHDSGPWLLLDGGTALEVQLERVDLREGRIFVDARRGSLVVGSAGGEVRAEGATFAIEADGSVYCGSGEITWTAEGGQSGLLAQGEGIELDDSPEVEAAGLWDDWTGGLADPAPWHAPEASYVGSLLGRRIDELGKARRPISVRSHEVDVTIHGDLATTTVTQTFFNAESETLEAHYRMRLPHGAIVSDFAADMGGGFMPASVTSMEWREQYGYNPNEQRLAYDGPNRVRARVSPIAPGQTVRLRLTYAHWMNREGSRRTYTYPMVDPSAEPPLVGEFRLSVNTSGNRISNLRAGMGAVVNGGEVVLRRSDYRPTADFHLDLIETPAEGAPAPGAVAYIVDAPPPEESVLPPGRNIAADGPERFVFVDIATDALAESEDSEESPGLDLALVVDVSGGTAAEDLELARAVVESALRQLAPTDRVAVLLGDVGAHTPEGLDAGFLPATPENAERILEALATAPLGGATDLGRTLRDASVLAAGRPRGAVLYLGDGLATTGQLDASAINAALSTVDSAPRRFALALGESHGLDLLRRVTEHAEAVTVRTDAARAVMRVLASAARPTLRSAVVDFGATVERTFPRMPTTLPLDEPLRFVGRLRGEMPETIHVSGIRDGVAFEREVSVRRGTIEDGGDIRRRWASARLTELVDSDAGREALVSLGMRYELLTPWTSLSSGTFGGIFYPVMTFDLNPAESAIVAPVASSGWRRRRAAQAAPTRVAAESTWTPRIQPEASGSTSGDGGLGRVAVNRTLVAGERGPRACYERRLITRPDLRGTVNVEVSVGGGGVEAKLNSQTLGDADVARCIVTEVQGLRFPSTDSRVTVNYSYQLRPTVAIGVRRRCSDASRQALGTRRVLWRERLRANAGAEGALSVWASALSQCELASWSAKRALLDLMVRSVGNLQAMVALHRGLAGDGSARSYLRRAILRRVHTPQQVEYVRRVLGLNAAVDWTYFSRIWNREDDAGRLRLVRRWLEVLDDELDLRIREIALLEALDRVPEARRRARELRAHPLADAAVYAAVGEFFLRQGDEAEARRVFSELVEGAPYDPWARRRLGDLYRAHGWYDDSYREYESLSRLSPADRDVLLFLARAAAGAGRTDEALRLEDRLAEGRASGSFSGAAGIAQLWSLTRLMGLRMDERASDRAVNARLRATGLLRAPTSAIAMLTWSHPEDAPQLFANLPSTPVGTEWERAEVQGGDFGMEAVVVPNLDEGDPVELEVRRTRGDLRAFEGTLFIAENLGTAEERFHRETIRIGREQSKVRITLRDGELNVREATR